MTNSLTLDRFTGYPINSFRVEERRSLTVHLEDAGMFDVRASADPNSDQPVFVGRYATFAEAHAIAAKLNAVWLAAPQSTAAEVVAFILRTSDFHAELAALLKETHETLVAVLVKLCELTPNNSWGDRLVPDGLGNRITAALASAESR